MGKPLRFGKALIAACVVKSVDNEQARKRRARVCGGGEGETAHRLFGGERASRPHVCTRVLTLAFTARNDRDAGKC